MATSVACGWAGAVFEFLEHLGRSSDAKKTRKHKKEMDGRTDGQTDGQTKRGVELRSTQLKRKKRKKRKSIGVESAQDRVNTVKNICGSVQFRLKPFFRCAIAPL